MLRKPTLLVVLWGCAALTATLLPPRCNASTPEKETFQRPGPVHLDTAGEKWAERTLRKLTLEEEIGQMIIGWVNAEFININSPDYLRLRDW